MAAPATGIALVRPEGWSAAMFVLPWLAVAMVIARRLVPLARDGVEQAAETVAAVYAAVAATGLLQSRLGAEWMGFREPIVELTAVHFAFAGVGALTLARYNLQRQPGRWALAAVAITAAAPPVVATGFVTESALAQVGGAILMTIGVWLTGTLQLRAAWSGSYRGAVRALLGTSGGSVWVPMVLAVAWAAAQHWDVPALSITDMVRTHGVLNAVGFTLCGLVGWRLAGTPWTLAGPVVEAVA